MKRSIMGCALVLLFPILAGAEPFIPFHLADVLYRWSEPVSAVGSTFVVMKHPGSGSRYYWSHFFSFSNSGPFGSDNERFAYMGLQTGEFANGSENQAIFSVWNGVEASGANCARFSGEGVGYRCTIPMMIAPGKRYEFEARLLGEGGLGDLWQARVRSAPEGEWQIIGSIRSPANSGPIVSSVIFHEYYGQVESCSDIPSAQVAYSAIVDLNGKAKAELTRLDRSGRCSRNAEVVFRGHDVEISSGPSTPP